jgi:hypothetical protein
LQLKSVELLLAENKLQNESLFFLLNNTATLKSEKDLGIMLDAILNMKDLGESVRKIIQ